MTINFIHIDLTANYSADMYTHTHTEQCFGAAAVAQQFHKHNSLRDPTAQVIGTMHAPGRRGGSWLLALDLLLWGHRRHWRSDVAFERPPCVSPPLCESCFQTKRESIYQGN